MPDTSVLMSSYMCVYDSDADPVRALSMDWFVESALGYRLTGEPVRSLCEHNATVARRLSRWQVEQTWRLLCLMCPSSASTSSNAVASQPTTVASLSSSLHLTDPGICCTISSVIRSCQRVTTFLEMSGNSARSGKSRWKRPKVRERVREFV